MRGFGVVVLIVGLIAIVASLSMDVSVGSGLGRVNNLGLMAERQNFTIVSALAALAGLLMILLGGKKASQEQLAESIAAGDTRPCPFCAEPIKAAAIKCKHCGEEVPKSAPAPAGMRSERYGWTVRSECGSPEAIIKANEAFAALGLTPADPDGMIAIAGYFKEKDDAVTARRNLASRHRLECYVYYQTPR